MPASGLRGGSINMVSITVNGFGHGSNSGKCRSGWSSRYARRNVDGRHQLGSSGHRNDRAGDETRARRICCSFEASPAAAMT